MFKLTQKKEINFSKLFYGLAYYFPVNTHLQLQQQKNYWVSLKAGAATVNNATEPYKRCESFKCVAIV